jgi:hypothetical protein
MYLGRGTLPLGSSIGEQVATGLALSLQREIQETERVRVGHDLGQFGGRSCPVDLGVVSL